MWDFVHNCKSKEGKKNTWEVHFTISNTIKKNPLLKEIFEEINENERSDGRFGSDEFNKNIVEPLSVIFKVKEYENKIKEQKNKIK